MTTATIDHRASAAAARFLTRKGYDVIETNKSMVIAAQDEVLVFARVLFHTAVEKGFPEGNTATRQELETAATTWLANSPDDYVDHPVRFDVIAMIELSPDRAFIRHNVNAFADSSVSEV